MDESMKVQFDIKNNAEDLQKYLLDLKNWEEDMKEKNIALQSEKPTDKKLPPPRNKIKRTKADNESNCNETKSDKKPKKILAYDYSSWDKFDVDKACQEVDKETAEGNVIAAVEDDENEEDEEDEQEQKTKHERKLKMIDEAFYEKELGNNFAKQEKWDEALQCYTRAIKYDSLNAIYYANRALCFIKLKNFKSAEVDSTVAIQIDKDYIKAYQRRAFARIALGQLAEAKCDYEQVLELEPKNSLAKFEISKIEAKLSKERLSAQKTNSGPSFNPKNMFETKESASAKKESSPKPSTSESKTETKEKTKIVDKPVAVESKLVKEVKEKETKQIKKGDGDKVIVKESESKQLEKDGEVDKSISKTLVSKDISFTVPVGCTVIQPIKKPPHKRSKKPLRRVEVQEVTETTVSCVSTSETKSEVSPVPIITSPPVPEEHKDIESTELVTKTPDVPKTAVQFQKWWKLVRNNSERSCSYLKQIKGFQLGAIFENSLESDLFSDLISCLASDACGNYPDMVYSHLQGLSLVRRFGTMVMFMSSKDKAAVTKCIRRLETVKSSAETAELRELYEL